MKTDIRGLIDDIIDGKKPSISDILKEKMSESVHIKLHEFRESLRHDSFSLGSKKEIAHGWFISVNKHKKGFIVEINSDELKKDNGQIYFIFKNINDAKQIYMSINVYSDFIEAKKIAKNLPSLVDMVIKGF
jgi:hypothetical protein